MTAGTPSLLAAVAAAGLPGSVLELPSAPLPDDRWRQLVDAVPPHRLQGHLAAAVRDGHLAVTASQREQTVALHRAAMVRVLRLERRLVETSGALSTAGIDHRVLKGSALAHLAHSRPDRRVFGDVDLLVADDDLDRAVTVLATTGHRRRESPVAVDYASRFGKGVTLVGPGGMEIDLHRTLAAGPYGLTLDREALFAPSGTLHLGGHALPTLDPDAHLLHACYTVALPPTRPALGTVRDLVQLVLRRPDVTDRFDRLVRRSRAHAVVALAVTRAWEELALADVVPLVVRAREYLPTASERRWLRAYRAGTYAALVRASMGALSGVSERAAILRALAVPTPEFLADHGQSRIGWVRRGLRRATAGLGS